MKEQDIYRIVEDAFDRHTTAVANSIENKKRFMDEVEQKVKALFKENDLSK